MSSRNFEKEIKIIKEVIIFFLPYGPKLHVDCPSQLRWTEQKFKSSLFRRKPDKVLEITASIFKRKLLSKVKI